MRVIERLTRTIPTAGGQQLFLQTETGENSVVNSSYLKESLLDDFKSAFSFRTVAG